jgi:hypothetical protein
LRGPRLYRSCSDIEEKEEEEGEEEKKKKKRKKKKRGEDGSHSQEDTMLQGHKQHSLRRQTINIQTLPFYNS